MPKFLSPFITRLPAIALAGLYLMLVTPSAFAKANGKNNSTPSTTQSSSSQPAQSSTSTPTSSGTTQTSPLFSDLTVGLSDLNKSFLVNFDGNVSTQTVTGLSSQALFTFKGFTTSNTDTVATFDILLKNTSSGAIDSRVSGLGFNTNQTLLGSSVSGLFENAVLGGSFPNQFGKMDVCFTDGKTCQGGQSGGVSSDQSLPGTYESGLFNVALTLKGAVNTLSLSNLGVRYQSIEGTSLGTSGTGSAVSVTPYLPSTPPAPEPPKPTPPIFEKPIDGTTPPDQPPVTPPNTPESPKPPQKPAPKPATVPEPSTIAGLLLVSSVALRLGKKRTSSEAIRNS